MPQVLILGDKIHYIQGESYNKFRPTLLFIHGAGQSIATWKFQKDLFTNSLDYNFIALDLPGHGSSEGSGLSTVSGYKDFVLEFIQSLQLQKAVLVGHSMGGGIAMLLALEHPELLRACVLVATGAKLSVAGQTLETVKKDYKTFCEIAPQRMFAENSPDELKQEFKKGLLETGARVCYQDLIACNEFNILGEVDKIVAPTLIVSADKDILTPLKYGEYLHQNIYGSEFYEIIDSGHFLMQEKAQEFNTILINFLNELLSDKQ